MRTPSRKIKSRSPLAQRLCEVVQRRKIIRPAERKADGIHQQILKRAVDRGVVRRNGGELYVKSEFPLDLDCRITFACRRVPHGIICLESALRFHGIVSAQSDVIWMAIDHKARKPALSGLNIRFVRFSGEALTQGGLNTRSHGEAVRVSSVAKTGADFLKYRRKLDTELLVNEARCQTKCTRVRRLRFARIYRLKDLCVPQPRVRLGSDQELLSARYVRKFGPPAAGHLAQLNSCSTISHDATYLGENRGACPGPGVFGSRTQVAEADALANPSRGRRTDLG